MPGLFFRQLVDLFAQTVTIAAASTGTDAYGKPTYGSATTYQAAIQGPVKFLHAQTNQERVSEMTIYVFSTSTISARDKLTLPAGYDGSATPPIMQVERLADETGQIGSALYLGQLRQVA